MTGVTNATERSERPQPLRRARVIAPARVRDDDRSFARPTLRSATIDNFEAACHLDSIGRRVRTEADPSTLEDLHQKPVATTVAPDSVGRRLA